jgi:hypothetical protein
VNFIDELLAEAEVADAKRLIEVSKFRADQLLMAISVLEEKTSEINTLVDSEVALFEDFRTAEISKLDKKVSWLVWNLEHFMKNIGEKTLALPHGELKLRKGKDKIEIADMEKFLKAAEKHGLLRAVPESFEPDMRAVAAYTKSTGISPSGTVIIPGSDKFTYTTKGASHNGSSSDTDKRQPAEAGTGSERECPAEIAQG